MKMADEALPTVKCSGCGKTGNVVRFTRDEVVVIRGVSLNVTKVLRRCGACGGEFESSEDVDHRIEAWLTPSHPNPTPFLLTAGTLP